MKNILITAISGQVGNGILKCLEGYDGALFGADVDDYPAGIDRVRRFYKVSPARDDDYIPSLLKICLENEITHLIPVNEEEIVKVSQNDFEFERHGIKVLSLKREQVQLCMDKYTLPHKLLEFGIDAPRSYLPAEFLPDGERYIVKLRYSSGSRLVKEIVTPDELNAIIYKTDGNIVVQQHIPSAETEYTIGVFVTENEVRSITFKRMLKNGYSQWVELDNSKEFTALAEKTARVLRIIGCFNIQLRRYEGKNYIFEINPRISGTAYFRHQLGFEDVRWWLAYSSGECILRYEPQYSAAIGLREFSEKFIMLKKITGVGMINR